MATFPVSLVFFFAFAVPQDNHLPLKFLKESQIVPQCYSCSDSPSHPKIPLWKMPMFCLDSSSSNALDPGTALAVPPAHPPIPLGAAQFLLSIMRWEGDSSGRLHIPKYHFLCSHRKPAKTTASAFFKHVGSNPSNKIPRLAGLSTLGCREQSAAPAIELLLRPGSTGLMGT